METKTYFRLPKLRILKIFHPFTGEDIFKNAYPKDTFVMD
jgi:hypothetical protein